MAENEEELTLREKLLEARTDKRFEQVLGEMRTTNAQLVGKLDLLGVQIDAAKVASIEAKSAAQEASSRAITTRWQVFFLVIGLFAAGIAVAGLVFANSQVLAGAIQAAVATHH